MVGLRVRSLRFYKIAEVYERSSSGRFDFTDIIENQILLSFILLVTTGRNDLIVHYSKPCLGGE